VSEVGVKADLPKWWDEDCVQEWIGKFADQKKYRINFIKWTEWIGLTPSEQLAKRKEDLKNEDEKIQRYFEQKLIEYGKEIMKEGIRKKTGEQYLIAPRSFFSHHYLALKFRRGEISKALEEIEEIKNSKKPKWVLDRIEYRALFNVCETRDRPLVVILGSTGLSPIDVANLRIESLRIYERDRAGNIIDVTENPVYGEKPRDKTGILQQFVLGSETMFYLKPLLIERGYPERGHLLMTRNRNAYTSRSINDRMQTLAERAYGPERAKEFQTKNLRDFFQNGLLLAKVNEKVIDSMMGWKKESAKQHYYISEEIILEAYNEAKGYWSVNGERQSNERVMKLEHNLNKQKELNLGILELIKDLRDQNLNLSAENTKLRIAYQNDLGRDPGEIDLQTTETEATRTFNTKLKRFEYLIKEK